MKIRPFAALHPRPGAAARVAAVPYDVVDRHEARMLSAGNRDHFLHVTRPEIDFSDSVEPGDQRVYVRAREALDDLLRRGVLVRDTAPRCYAYRQIMGEHSQIGLVACCEVDDYANGTIRLHEKTRKDKEDDRTRHTLAIKANTGPVFLMFRDQPAVAACLTSIASQAPMFDFASSDSVRHTVWDFAPDMTPVLQQAFADVPAAYVADGHHRAAAAFRAAQQLRQEIPGAGPEARCNGFMAVLFPASSLNVLPYHRTVRDLNGMTSERFLARLAESFRVETLDPYIDPAAPGQVCMRLADQWYRLSWTVPSQGDGVDSLDASVLQSRLLNPLLDIGDPRRDKRIDFVGGIRGTAELERRVDGGQAAVAFAMHPVTVEQIMAVADQRGCMPPKSTWFEPKLRSGLLVCELGDGE